MRGKYKKKHLRKRYYKVWRDEMQSIWLVVEQLGNVVEVYTRGVCSYDGPLKRNDNISLLINYKKAYKTQEISQQEAFLELL